MAGRGVIYDLRGLRDCEAALERASLVVRTQVGRANQETAFAIARRARANVQKDRGDLANAIAVQGKGLTWRVGLLDVTIPSRGGDNSAHLNPSVYGRFIEYGTVNYSAHPFMRPAVDAELPLHDARLQQASLTISATAARAA